VGWLVEVHRILPARNPVLVVADALAYTTKIIGRFDYTGGDRR
jgi:hypothetical protein